MVCPAGRSLGERRGTITQSSERRIGTDTEESSSQSLHRLLVSQHAVGLGSYEAESRSTHRDGFRFGGSLRPWPARTMLRIERPRRPISGDRMNAARLA